MMEGNQDGRIRSREIVSQLLLDTLPHMRAFARSLTRDRSHADDLVQEAAVRALSSAHQFTPGTAFKAWVFVIIRNAFYREIKKQKIFDAWPDELHENGKSGDQEVPLRLCDFRRAFWKLSPAHREVLTLIGPVNLTYDEVAIICGCPVGTVKSRINRARAELENIMNGDGLKLRRVLRPIGSETYDGIFGEETLR